MTTPITPTAYENIPDPPLEVLEWIKRGGLDEWLEMLARNGGNNE